MIFTIDDNVDHILVLGAGASVDYGLPVWSDLSFLIAEKINKDKEHRYQYKKEILDWVDKVGEKKKYNTIDECIKEESASKEYHSNGHLIEDQIFSIIKDILNESYKEYDDGWLRLLNKKILSRPNLEHRVAFINYNYDSILDRNFLDFNFLSSKHKIWNYKSRLEDLSGIYVKALFPHGNFFLDENQKYVSCLLKESDTIKSSDEGYINAVSCYESKPHTVVKNNYRDVKLYILGLGGGMKINMSNIKFQIPISEIHVTIKNPDLKEELVSFLSKQYKLSAPEIKVYESCGELVENCF